MNYIIMANDFTYVIFRIMKILFSAFSYLDTVLEPFIVQVIIAVIIRLLIPKTFSVMLWCIFSCSPKSDALISDLLVSYTTRDAGMDFYRANHPENSANEIQVMQAKIIIDLENLLAGAALCQCP